jgi:hypothetical protein
MYLGIDHLVIAVGDPDAAARMLESDLGIAVTGGGRHAGAGTFNRLAFLGDTYLELIGVEDRALTASADAGTPVGRAALALLDTGMEDSRRGRSRATTWWPTLRRCGVAAPPSVRRAPARGPAPTARWCAG